MGCASSTPLVQGASPQGAPPYDLRQAADPDLRQDDSVAGKVRQTVTGMAEAVPVQDLIDGVSHAKDEALHKLHDFGETMKDKVESVVDDVEDKIGSAFGTVKDKAGEEMKEAEEALDEVQQAAKEKVAETVKDAEQEVDTMVEDLEESLPPPPPPAEHKDFQMDTLEVRPGSQASTARLSRKSGEEEVETGENAASDYQKEDDTKIEHNSRNSFHSGSVKSLKVEIEQSNRDESEPKSSDSGFTVDDNRSEENNETPKEVGVESHLSGSRKSSASKSALDESIVIKKTLSRHSSNEFNITPGEEPMMAETEILHTPVPVAREDSPKAEDTEEDKEKAGKISPLSVEQTPMMSEPETIHTPIPVARGDSPKAEDTDDNKEKAGKKSPLSVELTPVMSETETLLTAIPVAREDSPMAEDTDDDKEKAGKKSPLSVELPPEVKDENQSSSPEQHGNATAVSETVHHSPTPITSPADNNLRPQSSNSNEERQPVVETPIEAIVRAPQESEVLKDSSEMDPIGNDKEPDYFTNSPEGKNDSAISSSSSVSTEKDLNDAGIDGRQGTPVIEVA